jgi:hypothetical protein
MERPILIMNFTTGFTTPNPWRLTAAPVGGVDGYIITVD